MNLTSIIKGIVATCGILTAGINSGCATPGRYYYEPSIYRRYLECICEKYNSKKSKVYDRYYYSESTAYKIEEKTDCYDICLKRKESNWKKEKI